MIDNDYDAFAAVIGGFAELKGRTLSAAAVRLYWRSMQHWALEDFKQAAEQLLRTCEFMPTPKDFEDLRRAGRLTAGEAWIAARACWRSGGEGTGEELTDRVVAILGGYRVMGEMATSQMSFLERRFAEHYAELQETEEVRRAVPQLARSSKVVRLRGPS